MKRIAPFLRAALLVAGAVFVLLLALSGFSDALVTGELGEMFLFLSALALVVATACSGALLWDEWRRNRIEDSEYGEWTNRQLLYAITFAIGFFLSLAYYLPALLFR